MKRIITFSSALLCLCSSMFAAGNSISGSWSGNLAIAPAQSLKLIFHFESDEDGKQTVKIDTPEQHTYGIQGRVNILSSDSVDVSVESLGMRYAGKWADGRIKGTFSQGNASLPLELEPYNQVLKRPQTPRPPFPYTTKDVKIATTDSTELAATITLPENCDASTPAVVMVTGSGLQNRDEEVFGHKPFAVIADYLARNGIASVRYDDRGCGQSTGDGKTATTADFAYDAQSVADYMRNTEHFRNIGILGHSEGASIAFILGARHIPDFIVAIGAPAVRGDSILAAQSYDMLLASGIPQEVAGKYRDALYQMYDAKIKNGKWGAISAAVMKSAEWDNDYFLSKLSDNLKAIAMTDNSPWLDYFIAYSPAADIAATVCPALVIYGEKDIQVKPSVNKAVMEHLAKTADVREYVSLNHLMQHAQRGTPDEYAEIEETFSPEVLSDITEFIKREGEL